MSLQESLNTLADLETQMSAAERDCEIYRIKKTHHIYEARTQVLGQIDKFWYIVLAENDQFADLVAPEDLKYLENIKNIHVTHRIAAIDEPSDDDIAHYKDFDVTFEFGGDIEQKVTKSFRVVVKDGEDTIESEPVDVKWPAELAEINPSTIKASGELSKEDKKKYRLGMKSFFAWFAWTGKKPGKEFRNGEDLAWLIVDDLYLNAIKYYVVALQNDEEGSDEEEDSSEGEELDLSDGERKKQRLE